MRWRRALALCNLVDEVADKQRYILDAFPRVVRDVARKQEKDVELTISGGDIELDRIVLDEMSDPLLHLVRNSIDHGIETPDLRQAAGKPPEGTLKLRAWHGAGQVIVDVIDDGREDSHPGIEDAPALDAPRRPAAPGGATGRWRPLRCPARTPC